MVRGDIGVMKTRVWEDRRATEFGSLLGFCKSGLMFACSYFLHNASRSKRFSVYKDSYEMIMVPSLL